MRAVAQSISYEVSLTIILIHSVLFFSFIIITPKLSTLTTFQFLILFLLLVTCLAETNRSPFDFSEGESELVRGFNTEYSAVSFVMLFLAEYISIVFMSAIVSLLFNMSTYIDL